MPIKTIVDQRGTIEELVGPGGDYPIMDISGAIRAHEYIGISSSMITGSFTASLPDNIAYTTMTRRVHEPTITPSRGSSSPGQGPTPVINNALLTLAFTPGDTSDRMYRMFKIPTNYVGEPSFHIHWTKNVNTNQSGNNARWRIAYHVFDGIDDIGNSNPQEVQYEGTYLDNGTTTRIVYRSPDLPLTGFIAGYYVTCFVEALTPTGSALSGDVGLFSVDLMYRININSGSMP